MMASRYHCGSLAIDHGSDPCARWNKAPDHDGALGRIKRDPMRFPMQHEVVAMQQIDGGDRPVVGQSEFPERNLVGAFLPRRAGRD